jgi:hypothetical protein
MIYEVDREKFGLSRVREPREKAKQPTIGQ